MRNGGIIKILIMVVIALSVLFLLLAAVANYTTPLSDQTSSGGDSYFTDYDNSTNSLIGFLDSDDYSSYSGSSDRDLSNINPQNRSKYAGKVSLSSGSASYAFQPNEEYVVIENNGAPVNITGWKLENGKGTRPIQYSQNNYVYPSAEFAVIGQGTEFLDPSGKYSVGPIVLKTGDIAIVTTSGPFSYFPLPITTNFRENICLGFLHNYPFNPPISKQCPYPTNDPQIRVVTDECFDYMQSLDRCQDPRETNKDNFDMQTSQCRAFMTARLNYPACVANNRYSQNFASKQWRVFLGRSHELWASQRELITLYDTTGLIVDQISY